jgi:hypothetical protein
MAETIRHFKLIRLHRFWRPNLCVVFVVDSGLKVRAFSPLRASVK